MNSRARKALTAGLALSLMGGWVLRKDLLAMAAGIFNITSFSASGGGGSSSGGAFTMTASVGSSGQSMGGGAFSMQRGTIGAVRTASAGLEDAHAYPNPYRPSRGHTKVSFSSLAPAVTIHIYTLDGAKVKTLTKDDPTDTLVWNPVANEQGSSLASGVYYFVITTPDKKSRKGKLMIIR